MLVKFNLTKYYADTLGKVDGHIVEDSRRTISYLKGYSYSKLYCKNPSDQKPTAIQLTLQEEQLYAECGMRFKSFYSLNLLNICTFLFITNLNKAK